MKLKDTIVLFQQSTLPRIEVLRTNWGECGNRPAPQKLAIASGKSVIEVGDLVSFKFPDKIAGALTALKLAKRMEARIKKRQGIVIELNQGNVVAMFEDEIIVVHKMFLEVINEDWRSS